MASAAKQSGNPGIFWMNGVSNEELPLVFVPGLEGDMKTHTSFNGRPDITSASIKRSSRMRARRGSGCKGGKKQGHVLSEASDVCTKATVSVQHGATGHSLPQTTGVFQPSTPANSDKDRAKSEVCLKDLCPEDKRRIANLIEELARVSEEKEESVQRLKDEQQSFECKIQQLEQQNLVIAQERESLQQQYRECQELLGLYQQYLSQQQAKLNESIAQLIQEPAHSKVLSGEEISGRTMTVKSNGSLLDGSYLGQASAQSRQTQVHKRSGGGRAVVPNYDNPASPSLAGESSPTNGTCGSRKRECREAHYRCVHCQDKSYGRQQWKRDDCSHLESGHSSFYQHEIDSQNAIGLEARGALTRPLLGHEDWEEKRHQLLLQKMQLEVEREKLQARLAEQEQRINRQNHQLRQSRLDSSGIQQAAQSDLSTSGIRNGDPRPEGPSIQDLPSSVHEVVEDQPAGQNSHEKQTLPTHLDNGNETVVSFRKDMATSPVKSHPSLSKPIPVSVSQKTPEARLDLSVVELLDIFTPAPDQTIVTTQRPRILQHRPALSAPKPVGRSMITPARPYPQYNQQDLEESQILEDIFFIC
ncbi:protein hinderin [Antennarius striatus]|uniref:protein hinderin n=1 Tax=Antennarius striatus TaxID=241820 RepID=UPI0035AE1A01